MAFVDAMLRRLLRRRMRSAGLVGGPLLLGLLLPWSSALSDGERSPVDLLGQMSRALSELEYEGTLVYLNGHELSTLRIAHRISGGQAHESLLALSGPVRAVARSRQTVTCVLPDARAISVPRHLGSAATLHSGSLDAERLRPYYLIHGLGRSRVAGRDTHVIGIIPRDNLRYGYRFYVDEQTGLPLKTDLMDSSATPIEQVMFTEIEFLNGDSTEAADTTPTLASKPPASSLSSAPVDAAPWWFSELPLGFEVVAGDASAAASAAIQRRWFMVSDGLSTVSVYIEPDQGHGLAGHKRVGAINAAGRSLNGFQITAVGEAPLPTVKAIAAAVEGQP
ncbi:MAG: MucB/RseB C-terminal domain-containing protein [Lamprobacter sp.]|uniref:MucB/RseB C-terminal domain-containing protein n=1 Tax=Lamprobacter sp. TaxID=3100796 RepID=UPI002B2598EE|nr:MucB/RseB C-terminal domain-containing protein [Lamprobacter sp.]MEA3640041.1 MucB/RseB C-terminal domain-containing protein [Lamprobacter sp.]